MQDCSTAMNDTPRLIFGYNRWERVGTHRESFGCNCLIEIFQRAKIKFENSLLHRHNPIISLVARNLELEQHVFLVDHSLLPLFSSF